MKNLAYASAAFFMLAHQPAAAAELYEAPRQYRDWQGSEIPTACKTDGHTIQKIRVINGDTFAFTCELRGEVREIIVRIAGASALELQQADPVCAVLAQGSRDALADILRSATQVALRSPTESDIVPSAAFGRLAGHVEVDGEDAAVQLMQDGHVIPDERFDQYWQSSWPQPTAERIAQFEACKSN